MWSDFGCWCQKEEIFVQKWGSWSCLIFRQGDPISHTTYIHFTNDIVKPFFDWDVLAHISSKVNDLCYHLLCHWYWYFNDSWTFCLTSERSISSFLDINAITNFSISIVIVGKPNKIKIIWLNYWVKLHKNS